MVALFAQQSNIIDFPPTVIGQGKSNEWYTPARYIEAAREVMGGIDLDPASCEIANQVVRAKRYYTLVDNGLKQDWIASSIWLNPPYSSPDGTLGRLGSLKGSLKPFILKLLEEYRIGNVKQAILLVNSDTDASWFVPLWNYPICFADHKVMFHRPGRSNEGQFFGTCFVYLGKNEQRFGRIAKAIDTPRQTATPLSLWEVD